MDSRTALQLMITYRYLILFPLAAVEGPIVALLVGFLISLGYFSFFPAFGIMILGDLIPDSFYYYLGRFGNQKNLIEKYGSRSKIISRNFARAENLWRDHGAKTMFFGKLAYGLSIPFLISAGLTKLPYKKFVAYALPATLFQYGLIMGIGYYLGNSYGRAQAYIHNIGIAIAAGVALVLTGYVIVSRFARKEIKEIEREELSEPVSHD